MYEAWCDIMNGHGRRCVHRHRLHLEVCTCNRCVGGVALVDEQVADAAGVAAQQVAKCCHCHRQLL